MTTRRFFDILFDVLTLLALAVAGVGHFVKWFRWDGPPAAVAELVEFQGWHAVWSGAALIVLAVLVFLSLTVPLGARARKGVVLLMFFATLAAIIFQVLPFSPYGRLLHGVVESPHPDGGYFAALIPTVFAGLCCLIRMTWTMGATDHPPLATPAFERPVRSERETAAPPSPRPDDAARFRRSGG